jgi:hypothetical protein
MVHGTGTGDVFGQFGEGDSPEVSRRFVRMMLTIFLPFTAVWVVVAWWLGLTSMWWLMTPPGLVLILIGWMREPGREVQALIAGVAFLVLGYWLFAR